MFPYRVVMSNRSEARITLKDHAGRLHRARALNALPEPGVVLKGSRPHLGFGLLVCLVSGQLHRVIFETINSRDASLLNEGELAAPAASAAADQPWHAMVRRSPAAVAAWRVDPAPGWDAGAEPGWGE